MNIQQCSSPSTRMAPISYVVWYCRYHHVQREAFCKACSETDDYTTHHGASNCGIFSMAPPAFRVRRWRTSPSFSEFLESWIGVGEQLHEVGLRAQSRQSHHPIHSQPTSLIGKHTWNQVPASGAGCKASLYPQWASYRVAELSEVPSLSPPGFTQTKASTSASPVLVVGRSPKPVLMTLHQSPQACWPVGCLPLRPGS